MNYLIVDTKTGRFCGKPYWSRRKARAQAKRLNQSCRMLWRFRCIDDDRQRAELPMSTAFARARSIAPLEMT